MLWILIALMLAAALLIIVVPLYRAEKKPSATIIISVVMVTALSTVIYSQIGTPNVDIQPLHETQDVSEAVTALAARLQENPDDLSGWKMLGRSYFSTGNFPGAIAAFERAVELEGGEDSQTLTDLGEAILYDDESSIIGRAGDMFENALALSPNNPKALFYGGMTAIQRGNKELGADRWEALLATSPPPNVQEILRQQIAEIRGDSPAPAAEAVTAPVAEAVTAPAAEAATAAMVTPGEITISVSLGDSATAANLPDSTVFVIVRDPAQPSPPISAKRIRLSELPTALSVGDADAMIPGRVPSGFEQLEIIARVSLTGQPGAATGDWFGDAIIQTSETSSVQIAIDQQVP